MTQIGRGGVSVNAIRHKSTFKRDYQRLDPEIQKEVDKALEKLLMDPRPPGIRFEKLQGHRKPPSTQYTRPGTSKSRSS